MFFIIAFMACSLALAELRARDKGGLIDPAEPGFHHSDFALLGLDHISSQRFYLRIFAVLQNGFGHVDGALMMRMMPWTKSTSGLPVGAGIMIAIAVS